MNINLLKGKIAENGFTLKQFSIATGIKRSALYRKFLCKTEFDRKEIEIIIKVLNLNCEQIYHIFFENKVS